MRQQKWFSNSELIFAGERRNLCFGGVDMTKWSGSCVQFLGQRLALWTVQLQAYPFSYCWQAGLSLRFRVTSLLAPRYEA